MSPEVEEKLGKAMARLAVEENRRMRERGHMSINYAARVQPPVIGPDVVADMRARKAKIDREREEQRIVAENKRRIRELEAELAKLKKGSR